LTGWGRKRRAWENIAGVRFAVNGKRLKMGFFSNLVEEEGRPAIKKAGWIPGVKDSRAY